MGFTDLFGARLLTKDGLQTTEKVLAGKTAVGIYFSAHWCPPCREFTPKLAEMYTKDLQSKGLEIVFVSSDKDEKAFADYYGEQPWVALPFVDRDMKNKLSKQFKVQGIPSFVIVDSAGKLITKDGREAVTNDPTGNNFPWIPPTAAEKAKIVLDTLGSELVHKTAGKYIGLYFSAHWCPPCRGFTPKLVEFYNNGLKERMEIIFVSSDKDEESFNGYCKEMPWLSLPYSQRQEKELLSNAFSVSGIPSLVVLAADGTVITTEGRNMVLGDQKGNSLPDGWFPQPFNDVNDDPSPLNAEQCVILMGASEAAIKVVKMVASEVYTAAGKDINTMPMRFFSAPPGDVTSQLRKLTSVEDDKLILLDIPSDGAFYVCDAPAHTISETTVREFIEQYGAGKLERRQLQTPQASAL